MQGQKRLLGLKLTDLVVRPAVAVRETARGFSIESTLDSAPCAARFRTIGRDIAVAKGGDCLTDPPYHAPGLPHLRLDRRLSAPRRAAGNVAGRAARSIVALTAFAACPKGLHLHGRPPGA